jgi:formylglycine-generating enzyme required for sulfatase activity
MIRSRWLSIGIVILSLQVTGAAQKDSKAPKLNMSFAKVKAGQFMMGCSKNDVACAPDEKPLHKVRITKPFEIGRYEVSQEEWQTIMEIKQAGVMPTIPIERISWDDVQSFIQRLNDRKDGYRYRLPTEAEWEYAARGGTDTPHGASGDVTAWHRDNSNNTPHPVGRKARNFFGLYDVEGNAAEWVQDWYDPSYYTSSPADDPTGPTTGQNRVVRGGSWEGTIRETRVSARASEPPGNRGQTIGFRVVREPVTP